MRALYTVKQKLNSDCSTGQLVTGGMLLHYEELKRPDGALRLERAGGASEGSAEESERVDEHSKHPSHLAMSKGKGGQKPKP